jgi:hypothetical protein
MPRYEISSPEDILPQEVAMAKSILQQATRYMETNGILFHRGYTPPWQECLSEQQAKSTLREVHKGQNFGAPLLKDNDGMVKRCSTC